MAPFRKRGSADLATGGGGSAATSSAAAAAPSAQAADAAAGSQDTQSSSRSKRIRRESSPSKTSSVNGFDQNAATVAFLPEKSSSNSPPSAVRPATKRNDVYKKWNFAEKLVFFEGLREHGRAFNKIAKLFEQKSKSKPDVQCRDVGQIRCFFARSQRKIASLNQIDLNCGLKKKVIDLLALINYGEILRRTGRELNSRVAASLNEMIHKGFTMMKVLGRVTKLKTPMCPVIKRFIRKRDEYNLVQLPVNVTLELVPKYGYDLALLRETSICNPYLRITAPVTRSVRSVLDVAEKKWMSKCYQTFVDQTPIDVAPPRIVFGLKDDSLSQLAPVQDSERVYTPPTFHGADELVRQGIGCVKAPSSPTCEQLNPESADPDDTNQDEYWRDDDDCLCEVDTSNPASAALPSTCSSSRPPTEFSITSSVAPTSVPPTAQETTSSRASADDDSPRNVYVVASKYSGGRQYIRVSENKCNQSPGAKSLISRLREGFTSSQIDQNTSLAKLLVMLNMPSVIQLEYQIHMPSDSTLSNCPDSSELTDFIQFGRLLKNRKNNSSHSPLRVSQVTSTVDLDTTKRKDGDFHRCAEVRPGSQAEERLRNQILSLQTSNKGRLKNRPRADSLYAGSAANAAANNAMRFAAPAGALQGAQPPPPPPETGNSSRKIYPKYFSTFSTNLNTGSVRDHRTGKLLQFPQSANGGPVQLNVPQSAVMPLSVLQPPTAPGDSIANRLPELRLSSSNNISDVSTSGIGTLSQEDSMGGDIIQLAIDNAEISLGGASCSLMESLQPVSLASGHMAAAVEPSSILNTTVDNWVHEGGGELLASLATPRKATDGCVTVPAAASNCGGGGGGITAHSGSSSLNSSAHDIHSVCDVSNDSFTSRQLDGEIEAMMNESSLDYAAKKFEELI